MGFDSVSLSTRTGLGSIYNQWKYAISNKKTTDNFKTYLLSSQEHLNQLEGLFTDYGHVDKSYGDTFVRESIVELKDGRLLCMDPNEAKAYILDLNDVNSSSEKYNLTVIKPEDESVSFAEQITNLISKITAQLGADGVTTTKDGTKIDSSIITGLLSGDTKTQYCDEMGVANTSETDNTYTSGALKLVAAKGITDITTSEDEIGYYSEAFKALGVEIEPDGTTFTSGGKSVISRLNLTIRDISKIIEKGTTATDQDKLNILETVRKMTTLEYELLERFNPGFTQALNTFVGDFQSRTYKDKNGNQTGADETISYQTVMQEKLNDMSNARSYLSSSDQTAIDKYIGCYIKKADNSILNSTNYKQQLEKNEIKAADYTLITKSNVNQYTDHIITNITTAPSAVQVSVLNGFDTRLENAKKACESSSKSKAYNAMYNAISQTVTLGVSESTIQGYKNDINSIKAQEKPDELLTTFLDISNTKDGPEIIARLLEDSSIVDKLKKACAVKGTLNILDSRTGKAKTGDLYNLDGQKDKREYNVNNILNHLEYITKSYYATKSDSTSEVNSSKASNTVGDSRHVAKEGDPEDGIKSASEANKIAEKHMAAGGAIGGVASVVSVGLGIKTATAIKAAEGTAKGIMYSNGWGFACTTEAAKAATAKTAAHWATALQGTGIAAGIVLGAVGGVWLANNDINKNIDTFTKPDGTFNNGKANGCKMIAGFSGAAIGGFAAAALLGATPIGWGLGIAAAIGAVGFGLYQVAKKWW